VRTGQEGLHDILDDGDVFIEETMEGRLLRVSTDRVIWETVSRVDDNTLSLVSWSRYLTNEQVENILPVLDKTKCS